MLKNVRQKAQSWADKKENFYIIYKSVRRGEIWDNLDKKLFKTGGINLKLHKFLRKVFKIVKLPTRFLQKGFSWQRKWRWI